MMKKRGYSIIAFVTVFLFITSLIGCTNNSSATASSFDTESFDENAFKPPGVLVKINLDTDDHSDSDILFYYDDDGRVSQCYYVIGADNIFLNYSYDGRSIQIFGFNVDGIVVAEASFEAKTDYDPSVGFVEPDGYFIKRFSF